MHLFLKVLEYVASGAAGLLVFVFTIGGLLWAVTGRDRFTEDPNTDPIWTGRFAQSIPVRVAIRDPREAGAIAVTALARAGATDIEIVSRSTVVAHYEWVFQPFAGRQMGIVIQNMTNSSADLLCCCRPRFVRQMFDYGYCQKLARRLASSVTDVVSPPAASFPRRSSVPLT